MKILVMGAGAMGTAVGGFMAMHEHDITLIGRKPQIDALKSKGLHITGIWGEHHTNNCKTYTSLDETDKQEYDLILFTVKSYDTERALHLVKPYIGSTTFLCSYQNGLGNAETLAKHIGWERVLGARVIFGARINQPGEVEITVIAEPTAIGAYQGAATAKQAELVANSMNESGIPTVYTDRIQTILWGKVAYNCALNPLSALFRCPWSGLVTFFCLTRPYPT